MPVVLHRKLDSHISYDSVLDHPSCYMSMDIDWLFKPVSHLVRKIQATKNHHSTRSTVDEARAGKMIYCHASYLSALNFVSLSIDDVELLDLVCY